MRCGPKFFVETFFFFSNKKRVIGIKIIRTKLISIGGGGGLGPTPQSWALCI